MPLIDNREPDKMVRINIATSETERMAFHQACASANHPDWPGAVAMYIRADIDLTIDNGYDMDINSVY